MRNYKNSVLYSNKIYKKEDVDAALNEFKIKCTSYSQIKNK